MRDYERVEAIGLSRIRFRRTTGGLLSGLVTLQPNLRLLTLDNVGTANIYVGFDALPTGADTDFILTSGRVASLRITQQTAGRLYVYVSGLIHTGVLNILQEGSP